MNPANISLKNLSEKIRQYLSGEDVPDKPFYLTGMKGRLQLGPDGDLKVIPAPDYEAIYKKARDEALELKQGYSDLPKLPPYQSKPIIGLQDLLEWCIDVGNGKAGQESWPEERQVKMGKPKAAKDKSKQTQEQLLAIKIINALNEWISVGSIENWIKAGSHEYIIKRKLPKEYHPNHYLKYRLRIRDKLWMDSIILKLKARGKDGLAEDIEQRQWKFISEVSTIDKNLESTSPMHLPNRQLVSSAARLANALKEALPCLGTQLSEVKSAETERRIAPAKGEKEKANLKIEIGEIQAENVQTGNHASIHKETKADKQNRGSVKKLLKIVGAIIVGLFVAFLADIFGNLGWTERITDFIYRIFWPK